MTQSRGIRWAFSCFFALVLVLSFTPFLTAQILTGSIGGTVTDATGAILTDVKVSASSPSLIGGPRTISADANGEYKFLELPPGTYEIRFEKTGFKSYVQRNIVLNTGVHVDANVKLS